MIYLDNSATTLPEKAVADKVYKMLTESFGNPSSFHRAGLDANAELRRARELVAKSLSADEEEIFFTSGGTEANNLAMFGAVQANRRRGKRIVTTAIEHESVLEAMNELELRGFEVIRLEPDKEGNISEEQIYEAVNSDTILVSIMYVNNEVGSVLPVSCIKTAVKRAGANAIIHTDCVQAYGKLEVKPKKLRIIEGAYSRHPYFGDPYDLRVLLKIDPAEQEARIRARNGEKMWRMFKNRWIPLENAYFAAYPIEKTSDFIL